MKLLTLVVLCLFPAWVDATPFLWADVTSPSDDRATHCVYTRTTPVLSPIVVDAAMGKPANGNRVCKVDLLGDSMTGTVMLAVKDSNDPNPLTNTSTPASFTFPAPLQPPQNLRVQ